MCEPLSPPLCVCVCALVFSRILHRGRAMPRIHGTRDSCTLPLLPPPFPCLARLSLAPLLSPRTPPLPQSLFTLPADAYSSSSLLTGNGSGSHRQKRHRNVAHGRPWFRCVDFVCVCACVRVYVVVLVSLLLFFIFACTRVVVLHHLLIACAARVCCLRLT